MANGHHEAGCEVLRSVCEALPDSTEALWVGHLAVKPSLSKIEQLVESQSPKGYYTFFEPS